MLCHLLHCPFLYGIITSYGKGVNTVQKTIKAINIENFEDDITVQFEQIRLCPHCNVSTNNDEKAALYIPTDHPLVKVYLVCFCTHCESIYFGEYCCQNTFGNNFIANAPICTYPNPHEQKDFSENIQILSPKFVEIYNQSLKSENIGLSEISGMGYRKALEFLIKDYAISFKNNESDNISKMPLSQVIDEFIDNKKIKTLAKASAWIGNDETHYQRKHENYDINHLKSFIHATVSTIDSDLEVINAQQLLNK